MLPTTAAMKIQINILTGKKNTVIIQHLTGTCLKLLQKTFHCQAFLFFFMDIQHNVSRHVILKYTPVLHFVHDMNLEEGDKVLSLIRELEENEQ